MKLKRKIALLLTLCTTCFASIGITAASASNVFDVPNLYYEMTIPNGYYAMSNDSTIDDGAIAAIFGAPGGNFSTISKNQIILINSQTLEPVDEFLLVVAKSDFTSRIQNFYNKSEEYLSNEWTMALADKKYKGFEFYNHPEARFVHTRSQYENDMFENYITIKNGLYYMLSARISGTYTEATTLPMLTQLINSSNFTSHDIIVRLNGKGIDFVQRPMVYRDRTMVPLRAIFEAMGAYVDWDGNTKTVTATKDDTQIKLQIGSNQLYVNGAAKELDAPALIYNDYTLVPARAVAEAFGAQVSWNNDARIVDIAY